MNTIIIDLDGTLCDVRHRLHYVKETPPNWPAFFDACSGDTPNSAVVALYDMAVSNYIAVIYVSGRPETHRAPTETWLARHRLNRHAALLMRPAGDYRPDAEIKRELYEAHIASKYGVLFTVDDRNAVVQMWRSLGLTCFQIADGDF